MPYDRPPFEIAAPCPDRSQLAKTTAAAQPSWTWAAAFPSNPSAAESVLLCSDLKIAATVLSPAACLGRDLPRRVSLSEVNLFIECLYVSDCDAKGRCGEDVPCRLVAVPFRSPNVINWHPRGM